MAAGRFGLVCLAFGACQFWRRWRRNKTAFERWKEYDEAKQQGLEYRASNLLTNERTAVIPSRLVETEMMESRNVNDPIPAPAGGGNAGATVQTSPTSGFMYASDADPVTLAQQMRPTTVESSYNPLLFAKGDTSSRSRPESDANPALSARPISGVFSRGGSILTTQAPVRRLRPEGGAPAMPPMPEASNDEEEREKE